MPGVPGVHRTNFVAKLVEKVLPIFSISMNIFGGCTEANDKS